MKIAKLSFVFGVFLVSLSLANAAYWVDDPSNCPTTDATNFPGQDCSPNDICGDSSGIAQCYDTSGLSAPSSSTTSLTQYSGSYGGGYLINCEATSDSAEPYCDNSGNAWCNRDSTCYSVNRLTECTANLFGDFSCSTCRSGYTYCDGDYTDADGCEINIDSTSYPGESNAVYNSSCLPSCSSGYLDVNGDLGISGDGCEIQIGGSCTLGDLSGTYDSSGDCVVAKSSFETGTESSYSTNDSLLWGSQYGDGYLINLTNGSEMRFGVNKTGSVFASFLGSLASRITKLFVQDIDASGNVDVGGNFSVGTSDLFVNSNDDLVGIGTASPAALLDVDGKIKVGNDAVTAQEGMIRFTGTSFEGYLGGEWILLGNASSANSTNSSWTENGSLIYYTGGNVGIGRVDPAELLDISGLSNPTASIIDTTNGAQIILQSQDTVGRVGTKSNHVLNLITNDTARMSIDTSGNVNISGIYYGNGSGLTDINASYANSSIWWAGLTSWLSGWLVNNNSQLEFNETKLNETISSEGVYLGFNSTYNSTYDAKVSGIWTNESGVATYEGNANITQNLSFGVGGVMYYNGTELIIEY